MQIPTKTFFEADGKFFYALLWEKGKSEPNFPIAGVETGRGHKREEFADKKIRIIPSVIRRLKSLRPASRQNVMFRYVSPGKIFLVQDMENSSWIPYLRLLDNFREENSGQIFMQGDSIRHFAINFLTGCLCFYEPLVAQYEMENYPVWLIAEDIKIILGAK
jgi:hypothetical protein